MHAAETKPDWKLLAKKSLQEFCIVTAKIMAAKIQPSSRRDLFTNVAFVWMDKPLNMFKAQADQKKSAVGCMASYGIE